MGLATARASAGPPAALNAPLFRQLIETLQGDERHVVLDLAATSSPMLSLFVGTRCCVEIAGLNGDDSVHRLNADPPAETLDVIAASVLPAHVVIDPVDAIFCWDLPNYLNPPALAALMEAVARRSRRGALAHALIVYSERTMPARPGHFVPVEDCRLDNRPSAGPPIDAPRYSPEDLERIMGPFTIDRVRLLTNGMQEFLFRLAG